jgi:DNA invertase Pin-like site-specific DNA recombinase
VTGRRSRKEVTGRPLRLAAYLRVSTSEQACSGAGIEAQRQAIEAACEQRGYELVEVLEDAGWSAKDLNRPGITEALSMLEDGTADGLIVAKLDRLSRSLLDFAQLMESARTKGWTLIVLDLGLDLSTPSGELLASVLATFAQFERRLIGQRTKDALAVKRSQGVTLGRPRMLDPATVDRIVAERLAGRSLAAIAQGLTDDGVPTATGKSSRWWPNTVRGILDYAMPDES